MVRMLFTLKGHRKYTRLQQRWTSVFLKLLKISLGIVRFFSYICNTLIQSQTGSSMKKTKRTEAFNWSRNPSRENISKVFLADPHALTTFGKNITKDEFCNSMATYNKIRLLEMKKQFFRNMFYTTLALIPLFFFIYNIFIGVSRWVSNVITKTQL